MKISKPQAKEKMLTRLKKIEGQVRGVQTMVSDERDCNEILQQLVAVRSAVQSATTLFLQEYASSCLLDPDTNTAEGREAFVENLVSLLGKMP